MKRAAYNCLSTVLILFCMAAASGCAKDKSGISADFKAYFNNGTGKDNSPPLYPELSFAVMSDIHIYDPSLGKTGAAFEKTMNSDRKLLLDSIDLFDFAAEKIIASGARFLLIPGDLTKDGELINHRLIAGKLKKFSDAGIKVFVIPGNHDVNNPGAVRYEGDKTFPVEKISAADFTKIYADFGYSAALKRDNASLSYLAEPAEGLWLLAIDSCRSSENVPGKEEIVSGKIGPETAAWIAGILQAASAGKKAVFVMMHHGVVEHWKGQSKLHPAYLVNGFRDFSQFLASWDARIVFTGHYHAQDITKAVFNDKFIYDIETGSLITAPSPIRFIKIKSINNGRSSVMDVFSDKLIGQIHPGTDFAEKGLAFVKKTVMNEAVTVLKKYKTSDKDALLIADLVGDSFCAHYSGDENPALRPAFDKGKLGLWGRFIYSQQSYAVEGLWQDLIPADNFVRLEL